MKDAPFVLELGDSSGSEAEVEDEIEIDAFAFPPVAEEVLPVPQNSNRNPQCLSHHPSSSQSRRQESSTIGTTTATIKNPSSSSSSSAYLVETDLEQAPRENQTRVHGGSEREAVENKSTIAGTGAQSKEKPADTANASKTIIHTLQPRRCSPKSVPQNPIEKRERSIQQQQEQQQQQQKQKQTAKSVPPNLPRADDGLSSRATFTNASTVRPKSSIILKTMETATETLLGSSGGHDNEKASTSAPSFESSSDNVLHSSPSKKRATATTTTASSASASFVPTVKDDTVTTAAPMVQSVATDETPALSSAQQLSLRNGNGTLADGQLAVKPRTTSMAVTTAVRSEPDVLPEVEKENENDDHPSYHDAPTVDSLLYQCWICAVPVQDPRTNSFAAATTIGWNVRHAHPLLHVSVCCVCAEEYAAAHDVERRDNTEDQQQQQQPLDESDDDSSSRCAGCGADANDDNGDSEDGLLLWLCDYRTGGANGPCCNRAFCDDCVAQVTGRRRAAQIRANDEPWYCPVCQPTRRIQQLQRCLTRQMRHRTPVVGRTVETVLAELEAVEEEKKHCERELECDKIIAVKRQEFRNELRSQLTTADTNASSSPSPADNDNNDLEEQVELAVQMWQEDWRRHHVRLSDRIAHLLDELDSDFHLSAAMCYNYMETGQFARKQNGSDDEEDDDEPDWVRRANKVVRQRIRERDTKEPWNPLSREMYQNVFYDDVEELGSDGLEPDDVGSKLVRSGWTRNIRPEEDAIQAAMESETKEFQRRRLHVKHRFDETQDKEEDNNSSAVARQQDGDTAVQQSGSRTRSGETVDSRIVKRNRMDVSPLSSSRSPTSWTPSSNKNSRSSIGSDKKPLSSSRKSLFASPSNSTSGGSIHSNRSNSSKVSSASIVLCKASAPTSQSGETAIRTIAVSPTLSKKLKVHQSEGVQFMFDNCFSDFAVTKEGDPTQVGGCILAHCMGLGKTLSTITLLHTMMTHPSMQSAATGKALVKKVLLIVPVNTIANWENEFDFWLRDEKHQIVVYNFSEVDPKARGKRVQQWSDQGGVLLISARTFQPENFALLRSPDVLCLDEAHTMLKNSATGLYKKLNLVETPRKLALTGSPFQNNLNEYFQMVSFVRPGILGQENDFDRDFVTPITSGLPSDASDFQLLASLEKSKELNQRLLPFVHRKDASVLRQDLPPLSQAVLTVRPTNMQTRMYRDYKRQKGKNNFFQLYQDLSPVNNHPGSVLYTSKTSYDEVVQADTPTSADGAKWWKGICDKLGGAEEVKGVMNGYKIVLLLHILAYCEKVNDKVLIFALNLNTLNYIEEVLAFEDWKKHVPSLADKFPNMKLGGWRSGEDYLRIDGSTNGVDRGKLVDDFNAGARDGVKAFLLSRAGGIGINLCAANRVVLVDNHFNPTVATQAVFRAYRYGQEKPVFCYRLLTQGTMEEKVYARCVTKTGIALRVIDKRSITRNFTTRELQNMMQHLTWVQCDKCSKWRVLLGEESEEDLPAKWYCELNSADTCNNSCEAEEKDQLWYENYIANGLQEAIVQPENPLRKAIDNARLDIVPVHIHTDPLLNILMELTDRGSQPLISKQCYHDAMLESIDDSKELERLQREISERSDKQNPNEHSDDQVAVPLPAKDRTIENTRQPSDSGKLFDADRVTDGAPSSAVATNPPEATAAKAKGQSPRQKKLPMAIKPGAIIVKAEVGSLQQKKLPMAIKPRAAIIKADGQSPRLKHSTETNSSQVILGREVSGLANAKQKAPPAGAAQKSTNIPHPHALIDLCDVDSPSVDENLPQNSRKRTKTKTESPSKKLRPESPICGTGEPGDAIDLCDSD